MASQAHLSKEVQKTRINEPKKDMDMARNQMAHLMVGPKRKKRK